MSYVALANITLGSSASSVTFSSIPTTGFRDLVVVGNFVPSGSFADMGLRFNGDGGTNYSFVEAAGNGSSANSNSGARAQAVLLYTLGTNRWMITAQIMDYSATDKHKTVLSRADSAADVTIMTANRWANTAAINSVTVRPDASTFASGSTFALYGIRS